MDEDERMRRATLPSLRLWRDTLLTLNSGGLSERITDQERDVLRGIADRVEKAITYHTRQTESG